MMIFGKKKEDTATTPAAAEQPRKEEKGLSPAAIKEKLKAGWLRAIIMFEVAGKPKKHVEETLKAYILNIKGDARLIVLEEDWGDPLEHEDSMISAFCEMEMLVENMEVLTWLSINFMPASIEIIEPESLTVKGSQLTSWFNDLLARLHEVSNILREEKMVNNTHVESLNALISNSLVAVLEAGEKKPKELEKLLGLHEKQLKVFLDHLIKKEKIVKTKSGYRIA